MSSEKSVAKARGTATSKESRYKYREWDVRLVSLIINCIYFWFLLLDMSKYASSIAILDRIIAQLEANTGG